MDATTDGGQAPPDTDKGTDHPQDYNFTVDLTLLYKAAKGISDATIDVKEEDVSDWLPSGEDLGRDDVSQASTTFGNRWDYSLNKLVEDCQDVGDRLGGAIEKYLEFDKTAGDTFKGAKSSAVHVDLPKVGFGKK